MTRWLPVIKKMKLRCILILTENVPAVKLLCYCLVGYFFYPMILEKITIQYKEFHNSYTRSHVPSA